MRAYYFSEKMKDIQKIGTLLFSMLLVLLVLPLLCQCGTVPITEDQAPVIKINSNDIQDYVCIVNRYLHPNMERYLNSAIRSYIGNDDKESDNNAKLLEQTKRGGFGSGFVYVDEKGNNFIITNYHVIVGAYRLSVTFRNEEEKEIVFKNLSVLNVDEQKDLAILAFPVGQRPFKKCIPLSSASVKSDTEIRAAGYPGIPDTPVWNITRGGVVNPRVTPPGVEDWFIQHDAAINPGNSGGPLLIADNKSFLKYSVVGINTFQFSELQGSNFAIPNERIKAFIKKSFEREDERTSVGNRLADFMELLDKSTTKVVVYKDISSFLSSTMINSNPDSTAKQIPDISKDIKEKVKKDPVVGISWAVAFNNIENLLYGKSRGNNALKTKPELLFYDQNNMGGYTARLLISGYPYKTEWIKEHGTWKLDDFSVDDGEYNDYHKLATSHPVGKKIIYSLSSVRDHDWYVLDIPKPGKLTVWTEGNDTDTMLRLFYDPSIESNVERPIGVDDDSGDDFNALISENVRAGKVYALVTMSSKKVGEYVFCVELE